MKKSVYSIVLADDIIGEVDKLAYKFNTNRSSMINEILAEYLSVITPEQRIKQIIVGLENAIGESSSFKILPSQTASTFSVKSALSYKYNPVIKYNVALYKNNKNHFGCIKAGIRTQNEALISVMNDFFMIFYKIENRLIEFPDSPYHEISGGKMTRLFKVGMNFGIDDKLMGVAISEYINNLDKMIKYYFENSQNPYFANNLERMYNDYLKNAKIIL